MAFFFSKIMKLIIFFALAFTGAQFALKHMPYTISPKQFRTFAEKAAGKPMNQAIQPLAQDLRSKYGPHIVNGNELEWIPLTVNGLNLQFALLSGAVTEYAGVWGSQLGTSGLLGTHWTNQSCVVLLGSVIKASGAGQLGAVESYSSSGSFRLNAFEPTFLKFEPETYVACYGRGVLPLSAVHLTTGTLLQNLDLVSFARFVYRYGTQYAREQVFFFYELFELAKAKALGFTK